MEALNSAAPTRAAHGAFCLRSADGQDLAVVRVLSTAGPDGPVSVSLDRYHRAD